MTNIKVKTETNDFIVFIGNIKLIEIWPNTGQIKDVPENPRGGNPGVNE